MTETDFFLPGEKKLEDVLHSGDDHIHVWVVCKHPENSTGDQERCGVGTMRFGGMHEICSDCGKPRYSDNWSSHASATLETRARAQGATLPEVENYYFEE